MSEMLPIENGVVVDASKEPQPLPAEPSGLENEVNLLKEAIASIKSEQTKTFDMFQQMFSHMEQNVAQPPTSADATQQTVGPQMPAAEDLDMM